MTHFTVEIVTAPALDEAAMAKLRRFLELVPGTVLIEDPDEPRLLFALDCPRPLDAFRFVDGLSKITDLQIEAGEVYETPEIDFETGDDSDTPSADPTELQSALFSAVQRWMDRVPEPQERLDASGDLICA